MGLVFVSKDIIRKALARERGLETAYPGRLAVVGGAFASLLLVGALYIRNTVLVPQAASNVFLQQMQMRRFIQDFYKGAVAVNDLGLTSYHNPYPVLDLAGLGSEQARLMMVRHARPDEYQALLASKDVHLAMVYQEWFPDSIPAGWTKVGTLSLLGRRVSAGEADVQFYATDPPTADRVRQELVSFKPSLPPGVTLTIF